MILALSEVLSRVFPRFQPSRISLTSCAEERLRIVPVDTVLVVPAVAVVPPVGRALVPPVAAFELPPLLVEATLVPVGELLVFPPSPLGKMVVCPPAPAVDIPMLLPPPPGLPPRPLLLEPPLSLEQAVTDARRTRLNHPIGLPRTASRLDSISTMPELPPVTSTGHQSDCPVLIIRDSRDMMIY